MDITYMYISLNYIYMHLHMSRCEASRPWTSMALNMQGISPVKINPMGASRTLGPTRWPLTSWMGPGIPP